MCLYLYIHLPLYIFYKSHAILQETKFTDLSHVRIPPCSLQALIAYQHTSMYKPLGIGDYV